MNRFITTFFLVVLFAFSRPLTAQQTLPLRFFSTNNIDTLVDYKHLSFRVFAQFKYQNLIYNEVRGESYRYIPKNLNSFGFGFANRYFIFDVGFNLKFDKVNFTKRFDFQGTLYMRRHISDVLLQRYTGYTATDHGKEFRGDITSGIFNINYMYNLNPSDFSIKDQFNPSAMRQNRSAGGVLVGGYIGFSRQSADSSMVPVKARRQVDLAGQLEKREGLFLGGLAGYGYSFLFKDRSFIFLAFVPGIGIQVANVETGVSAYEPDLFPAGKLLTRASVGKRFDKSYLVLSFNSDFYFAPLSENSSWYNHTGRVKLAYGFIIQKIRKPRG